MRTISSVEIFIIIYKLFFALKWAFTVGVLYVWAHLHKWLHAWAAHWMPPLWMSRERSFSLKIQASLARRSNGSSSSSRNQCLLLMWVSTVEGLDDVMRQWNPMLARDHRILILRVTHNILNPWVWWGGPHFVLVFEPMLGYSYIAFVGTSEIFIN